MLECFFIFFSPHLFRALSPSYPRLHKLVYLSPCRLVYGIAAGVGLLHEAGHPQRVHGMLRVVDL